MKFINSTYFFCGFGVVGLATGYTGHTFGLHHLPGISHPGGPSYDILRFPTTSYDMRLLLILPVINLDSLEVMPDKPVGNCLICLDFAK